MRFILLLSVFISSYSNACSSETALDIGLSAIIEKYPEYNEIRDIFTVEEQKDSWLILRKWSVFRAEPKEYPRVAVNKQTCEIGPVIWSK